MERALEKARRRKNRQRSPRKAPEEIEIVQAFVNTKNLKKQTEELSSPGGLSAWLARQRLLLDTSEELSENDLRRTLDARDGIHALLRANNGAELDISAIKRLADASKGARIEVSFDHDGSVQFEAVSSSFTDVFSSLLGMIAMARIRDDWPRLKACANSECQAAFWDARDRGKWCSHRCGDQMRSRVYRQGDRYKAAARFRKGPPR